MGFNKCGGIIFNRDYSKVLCIMNTYSYQGREFKWGLPGGSLENNERYKECARREIFEETNILFNLKCFRSSHKMNNYLMYIFHINENNVDIKINDKTEIQKIEWKSLEELKKITWNNQIRCLVKRINSLENKSFYGYYKHIIQLCN